MLSGRSPTVSPFQPCFLVSNEAPGLTGSQSGLASCVACEGHSLAACLGEGGDTVPISSDFDTPGFSIRTAYYLASACQASYLEELGDWAVELALGPQAAVFGFAAFHGFLSVTDQVTLLAFRGTDSIENWLTD